jgi:hypothetical protein
MTESTAPAADVAPPVSSDLVRAIDDCLVAGHAQRHWLRPGHPPFEESLSGGMAHYGGMPGAAFDLWCMCRAIERLRFIWTGKPGPEPSIPPPEPDEAPGLTVEPHGSVGDDKQPRLSNGMGQG